MASTPEQPSPPPLPADPGWSLALSGGGHRASLFTYGALLYMCDTGLNRQVASIASVSGGSLTNGQLAAMPTAFRATDPHRFRLETQDFVHRIATRGTVQWAPPIKLLLTAISMVLLVAGLAWLLPFPASLILSLLGVVVAAVLFGQRSRVAERVLRDLYDANGPVTFESLRARMADPRAGTVAHVFCATELQSSEHAYLSPRFGWSHEFGLAKDPDLRLSQAVWASSCFPGGFPPVPMSSSELKFSGGGKAGQTMWLADGGIYDNMADEWVEGRPRHEQAAREQAESSNAELVARIGPMPKDLLVVNASGRDDWAAASGVARVPILGELLWLLRDVGIMHSVTTTSRRSSLVNQFDLAGLMDREPVAPDPEVRRRVGPGGALVHVATVLSPLNPTVTEALRVAGLTDWAVQARKLSLDAGTALDSTGRDTAAALIWHGYALTSYNLHLFYGLPLDFPSREAILDIVDAEVV